MPQHADLLPSRSGDPARLTPSAERLAPDGWLLLGHAEAGLATASHLAGVEAGGVVAYRRAEAAPAVVARAIAAALAAEPIPSRRRPPRPVPPPPALLPAPPVAAAEPGTDADALGEVRRLLDAGEVDAASLANFASARRQSG